MVDTWHSRGTPARKRRNKNWAALKDVPLQFWKRKILSLDQTFWICKSTWAFAIMCAYLFRLDIAIEICPKLKDGRSASVANQTGEKPLPHRLALQIHFACLPNFKIMAAKCQKMSHFFNTALKKLGPNSGPAVFLHLLRRGTSRCSRCICFRILSKLVDFHPSKNGCNENGCHQPTPWRPQRFPWPFCVSSLFSPLRVEAW